MTTSTDPDFDPRFDPAFQRGFSSDVASQQAPAKARPAPSPPQYPQAAPTAGTPPTVTAPPVPGAAISMPVIAPSDISDAAADVDRERRPNPFLISLGALSVALIAAGVWGVQTARAPFLSTNVATDVDFVGLQILQLLAPMAIALGVATAVGILFVFAVGWQRAAGWQKRRPSSTPTA